LRSGNDESRGVHALLELATITFDYHKIHILPGLALLGRWNWASGRCVLEPGRCPGRCLPPRLGLLLPFPLLLPLPLGAIVIEVI
jgi:hypothetical protein